MVRPAPRFCGARAGGRDRGVGPRPGSARVLDEPGHDGRPLDGRVSRQRPLPGALRWRGDDPALRGQHHRPRHARAPRRVRCAGAGPGTRQRVPHGRLPGRGPRIRRRSARDRLRPAAAGVRARAAAGGRQGAGRSGGRRSRSSRPGGGRRGGRATTCSRPSRRGSRPTPPGWRRPASTPWPTRASSTSCSSTSRARSARRCGAHSPIPATP